MSGLPHSTSKRSEAPERCGCLHIDKGPDSEPSSCRHLGVESTVSGFAVSVHTPRRAAASGDRGGGRCSYRRSNALKLLVSLQMVGA